MALTPRDKRALTVGGAAIAIMALYFGVIEPAAYAYGELTHRHSTVANRLAMSRRDAQKREYMSERVRTWEAKAGTLSPPKPYGEAITTIGSQIVAAAQSCEVELQGEIPTAATPWPEDSQLQQAIINVDAQSDWEKIFKFIAALYHIDGVLSVEQMDLNMGERGKLKVRLGVSIFIQAAPAGGGSWAS